MDSSLKVVQILRFAMLGAILMYALVGETVASRSAAPNPVIFYSLTMVAIMMVGTIFVLRRVMVSPAEALLAGQPGDTAVMGRVRSGYIVTYVLGETIALFGFVLRMLGFNLALVAPFYVAGILLILYFAPRRPDSATG
jgi:hypothetical protein